MDKIKLTQAERRILDALIQFKEENAGSDPTLRQLAGLAGYRAQSNVSQIVNGLIDSGHLFKAPGHGWIVPGSIWLRASPPRVAPVIERLIRVPGEGGSCGGPE